MPEWALCMHTDTVCAPFKACQNIFQFPIFTFILHICIMASIKMIRDKNNSIIHFIASVCRRNFFRCLTECSEFVLACITTTTFRAPCKRITLYGMTREREQKKKYWASHLWCRSVSFGFDSTKARDQKHRIQRSWAKAKQKKNEMIWKWNNPSTSRGIGQRDTVGAVNFFLFVCGSKWIESNKSQNVAK